MLSSSDGVTCTVSDGEMWKNLDSGVVKIPSPLLNKSKMLVNTLSVAHSSVARKDTVAAPKAWLQARVACYCNEEQNLSRHDITVLVNCLGVYRSLDKALVVTTSTTYAATGFTARHALRSTLPLSKCNALLLFNCLHCMWEGTLARVNCSERGGPAVRMRTKYWVPFAGS
jgi:hypothetical protein